MEPWKLVPDEAAFDFFLASRAPLRRRLLSAFDQLRADPHRTPDYRAQDSVGRPLMVWATRPFLVTYWLDALVREVRIVDLQEIQY